MATDTSASDNLLFILVIGMGLTVWLMPQILQFEASAREFYNSLVDDYNSIVGAIGAFVSQIEAFVSAIIAYGPILIQVAVFAIQFILVLFVLGVGVVLLAHIKDEMSRGKAGESEVSSESEDEQPMSELHRQQLKEANETWRLSNWRWEQERPNRLKQAMKLARKWVKEEKRQEKAQKAQQKIDDEQARINKIWEDYQRKHEELLARDYILDNQVSEKDRVELKARGYERLKASKWGDTGASWYWVKKNGEHEGPEHSFFCYLIRDRVQEHLGKKIVCSPRLGADIVFDWKGKKYAIDVETGTNLEKHKQYVVGRYADGSSYGSSYDVMFIFVTSKRLKRKYARFGRVITRASVRKVVEDIFRE